MFEFGAGEGQKVWFDGYVRLVKDGLADTRCRLAIGTRESSEHKFRLLM